MYNSPSVHEAVMREYERMRNENEKKLEQRRNAVYEIVPAIAQIDREVSMLAVKNASRIISEGITAQEAVNSLNEQKEKLLSKRRELIEEFGVTDDAEPEYNCPICHDTGAVNGKRCSCYMDIFKKVMRSSVNGSSDISIDFDNDTFDNFSLEWYSKTKDERLGTSPYDNMNSVLAECKLFCMDFNKKGGNLYFYGASGTGKTFMTNCIANFLIRNGNSVIYQSAYKLFQFMEDYKFGRINAESVSGKHDSIYNSDLLIIDDLGTEFMTAYTCSVLFDILNTRLCNGKSTIISTNLSVGKLKEKYTDRISSRIIGNFELMRFIGDDIRIAKKLGRR